MENHSKLLECKKLDENDYIPFATTTSSGSFFSHLSPEGKAIAETLNLPEYVKVKDFTAVVQQSVFLLYQKHDVLVILRNEKIHREKLIDQECTIRKLLFDASLEHRELVRRWIEDSNGQQKLMAEALRKFYKKALYGESLFHQLWKKHKIISEKKLDYLKNEKILFSETDEHRKMSS